MNAPLLSTRRDARNDSADHVENWQPGGRIVRKLARDLAIPTPTAIALLEAAGIDIETP